MYMQNQFYMPITFLNYSLSIFQNYILSDFLPPTAMDDYNT